MGDDLPPEREIKDFYFKIHGKVRLSPSPPEPVSNRSSLLAVSNKYGIIFAGTQEGFKVLSQAQLSQKLVEVDKIATIVEDFDFISVINTGSQPTHIALSADDLSLAVCVVKDGTPFAYMYDVRSFAEKNNTAGPFMEVRLSATNGVNLIDFSWNPGSEFSSIFAACTSDGCLGLFEARESLRVVAGLPNTTGARALCWSPKGKQLVVGKANGSLMQYDQQLKPKKEIPCPPEFQNANISVLDVFWQSTHVFIGVYAAASGDASEPPCVMVVNVPKGESPNYVKFDDICYGSGEDRKHKYYVLQIPEWEMILTASANALEAAVLGKHPEQKAVWERWSLDDAGRAELPLTEDYRETMPSGMAVSLTSQNEIPMGDNIVHPASPLFMMLSTDGLLISFHMINTRPGLHPLVHPPEVLSSSGKRGPIRVVMGSAAPAHTISAPASTQPNTLTLLGQSGQTNQPKALFQTAKPSAPATAPAPAVTASAEGKALFGSLTLGQSTSTPSKAFSFGQKDPSMGSTFGQPSAVPDKTPSSLFNLPSSSGSSGAANFSFNKAQTTSAPAGSTVPTGFNFGVTGTSTPAQPSPGSFSFSGTKSDAAQSVADQSKPAASLFNNMASGKDKAPSTTSSSFGFKPAATAAVSAAPVSVIKPSPAPTAAPLSKTTAPAATSLTLANAQKPTSAFSASQSTTGAKRTQASTSNSLPQALTTQANAGASPQTRPTLKPQTAARRSLETPANAVDNPFMKSIVDEMTHFSQELGELASRCKKVNNLDIGTETSKESLRLGTSKMSEFCKDIKETMQSLNNDATHLKASVLEGFSLLEECQVRQTRENEPSYKELLRSRALDPASARLMKSINTQYHYLDSSIRNIDLQLDAEWEQYQRGKNESKRIRTPATDALYHTLRNNHNILHNQAHSIEKLVSELQKMRVYNTTSSWQSSPSIGQFGARGDTPQLSKIVTTPVRRVSASPLTPEVQISPERQNRLREALSKRRVTPVKSTAPGNLSMSKIVSASSLRRMLAEDEDLGTPPSTPPRISSEPPKTIQPSPQRQGNLRKMLAEEEDLGIPPSTPPRISSEPPKTVQPITQLQQPIHVPATVTKPPGGLRHSHTAPGLISLLQSPQSGLKPITKPAQEMAFQSAGGSLTVAKPISSGGSSPKPAASPATQVDSKPSKGFAAVPSGGITIGQSASFKTGSLGVLKVSQERPSDPAAKVISQNAAAAGTGFSSPVSGKSAEREIVSSTSAGFTPNSFSFPGNSLAASPATTTTASFPFTKATQGDTTSFGFNSPNAPTKPGTVFSFGGLGANDTGTTSTGPFKFNAASTSSFVTAAASTPSFTITSGSNKLMNIPSSAEPDEVPELLEAGYSLSPGTEEWEIDTRVSVDINDASPYEDVTPPVTPATTAPILPGPKDGSPADIAEGRGVYPSVFSFRQNAQNLSPGAPGGFFADPNQKKNASTVVSATTATTGIFSFSGKQESTAKSGFTFGAGAADPAKSESKTAISLATTPATVPVGLFGDASSLSNKTTLSGATITTSAPIFGATVVSGAGASGAPTSIPAPSWKPIVSANSSVIAGSLTTGTPLFGSGAAAPTSVAVNDPIPASSTASAAVTSATVSSTSSSLSTTDKDAAASASPDSTSQQGPSGTDATSKNLSGQGSSVIPDSSTPSAAAPSVVKSLFGQPPTTATPAFGGASSGLKPAASVTTAVSATGAETTPLATGFSFAATTSATVTSSTVITTTGGTLFGKPVGSSGLFGSPATTTTVTSSTPTTPGLFGSPAAPSTGLFGNASQATPSTIFGNKTPTSTPTTTATVATTVAPAAAATTTPPTGLFGSGQTASAQGTTGSSLFSNATATTTTSSLFGANNGASSTTTPATTKPLFSTTSANPTSTSTSLFGQAGGGTSVFQSDTSQSSSTFGGQASTGTSSFGFGQPVSSSGFGQTSFGQKSTPAFGQQPAQPLFGGQTSTSSGTSVFGQSTQATPGSGGLFGGGGASAAGGTSGGSGTGFFSGLGGKPSSENANKNVFGSTSFAPAASNAGASTGLFGSPTTSAGGTFGSGPFSGSGSSPSVSFGGFGGNAAATTTRPVGFGAPPAFGGSPSFGSPPAFGGAPAFGSNPAFASPVASVQATTDKIGDTGGFASFASSNTPTFGGIAQQPSSPTFGSVGQSPAVGFGGATPTSGFGSPGGSVFGGAASAQPTFGGQQQQPSFGGFGTSSPSSFTSYRS